MRVGELAYGAVDGRISARGNGGHGMADSIEAIQTRKPKQ